MAKHDRRKRSSQPPSSRTVTIQVPLPVLGVLNGVREAFHGLCIKTGMQVLEAMMAGDRRAERCQGSVPWLVHQDRDAGPGGDDGGIEKTCAARRGAIRSSGPRGAAGAWPVR